MLCYVQSFQIRIAASGIAVAGEEEDLIFHNKFTNKYEYRCDKYIQGRIYS